MKKLKIGIEVQRLFRQKKHGMEVVALELIREIQKLDSFNEYILYARTDVDENCIIERDNFVKKSLPAKSYFTWEQITLPLEIRKDNVDILHSTCNTSTLFSKVPLILTLHDIIYLENINFKGTMYQNLGNLYRRFIVPIIVKRSRIIITVSNYEKEVILKKFQLPEEKVKVVYNAVNSRFNTSYSRVLLDAFKKEHRLPDEFILFLGNTAPKKNTVNVIKAYLSYIADNKGGIPLAILDYDRSLVYELLVKLKKQNFIKYFIFPGYVSFEEMPLLYNSCKLFLYPSLRESFGLPILEAMSCGVPVVTSNTSSMPEIGGDAALYVDPLSYHDIKEGIVQVLSDESVQQSMKKKGLKRAGEFSWKASAEQLISIYNSIRTGC